MPQTETKRRAWAAGIGEGTIFRAFEDKDELLEACLLEALRPDTEALVDVFPHRAVTGR